MTAELRATSRKNKIIKSFSVGAYSKAVGVIVTFTLVPLAVNYLGVEGYGLWVAVSSLVAMLAFVDGGAGNALVNMVSHATGVNSKKSLKAIVSSGFVVLLAISIIGALLFSMFHTYIPWPWVFGMSESMNSEELQLLVLVVVFSFFIGMPCSVVGNVQRGFQEGNIEAFWNAKGRLLSLLFVFIAIQIDAGLIGFACAFVSGPIVASIANGIYYFYFKRTDIVPAITSVRSEEVKEVLSTGGMFFVLQLTAAIQSQGDNIIIANMLGPASVAQYAICMQLFMIVPTLLRLVFVPLWPAYREALASGDVDWVRRVFAKSMKLALLVGLPSAIILVLLGSEIIRLWVGDEVLPSLSLLIGCGLWLVLVLVGVTFSVFFNAIQWIKVQIFVATSAGLMNVGLTIYLVGEIGVEGAIYGSVISYFICAILPLLYFTIKKLSNLEDHLATTGDKL